MREITITSESAEETLRRLSAVENNNEKKIAERESMNEQTGETQDKGQENNEGRGDSTGGRRSFVTTYSELMNREFNDGEPIAFHAARGEVALVQSVTDKGKSTLIRNVAFALTAGKPFGTLVSEGTPRKVLLLNFEGAGGRFRDDLAKMERSLTGEEVELVKQNFLPTHAPTVEEDEPLSLSRHMGTLTDEVKRHGADVVIIDTASAGFWLRNENDNSEVANEVMKRLIRLARQLNALVVLVHHIGKGRGEEGQTREAAHRGRGASAWADFSTSIFNLEGHSDSDRVTLKCAKRKDGEPYERTMLLDRKARWFTVADETPKTNPTCFDVVVSLVAMRGRMKKADVVETLKGQCGERVIENALSDAAKLRKLHKLKRGWYGSQTVSSAPPNTTGGNVESEGRNAA